VLGTIKSYRSNGNPKTARQLTKSGHSASVRRLFAPKSEVVCCGEGVLSVIEILQQPSF
jgi:hypothetical protein